MLHRVLHGAAVNLRESPEMLGIFTQQDATRHFHPFKLLPISR